MRCDRCHAEGNAFSMSYFNTQMICPECENAERAHPDYQRAVDAEREAVANGDHNFEGIGLPADLR